MAAPAGGLERLYVRLLRGMSVSVAVTFSFRVNVSYTVWLCISPKTGGAFTSSTVTVNVCESEAMPSDTVTLSV